MGKVTMVTLATVSEGAKREFTAEEAEYLLRMKRSGWQLPEDSEYELKDGTISRRDKKKDK